MFSHEAVRHEMKQRYYTRMFARNISMLTQFHKTYRVDLAMSNKSRELEKVAFIAEVSIWLAGGRVSVCCKGDSKPLLYIRT